jgi:hypothetical protein
MNNKCSTYKKTEGIFFAPNVLEISAGRYRATIHQVNPNLYSVPKIFVLKN